MTDNVPKNIEIISYLDRKLIEGHSKLTSLKEEYIKIKQGEHPDEYHKRWENWKKSHCKKIENELDEWSGSIKKYLQKNKIKARIQYHFLAGTDRDKIIDIVLSQHQSSVTSSITKLIHWNAYDEIELLTIQWEKYLQNLEEIIIQLENSNFKKEPTRTQGTNFFSWDKKGTMLFLKGKLVLKLHKDSGRAKIFNALWENKTRFSDDTTIEPVKILLRSYLCQISGYKSNENIDKAVAFFRKKLKELPIEITAEKGFRLIIKD